MFTPVNITVRLDQTTPEMLVSLGQMYPNAFVTRSLTDDNILEIKIRSNVIDMPVVSDKLPVTSQPISGPGKL